MEEAWKEVLIKTEAIEYVINEYGRTGGGYSREAYAELAALKKEYERLRKALEAIVVECHDQETDWQHCGLETWRIAETALDQELMVKEDKIAQCRKRAVELVYGGKCDHMAGAEIRRMLVDEFGEEEIAANEKHPVE